MEIQFWKIKTDVESPLWRFEIYRAKVTLYNITVTSKKVNDFVMPFVLTSDPVCSRITLSVLGSSLLYFTWGRNLISWETISDGSLIGKDKRLVHLKVPGWSDFHVVNLPIIYTFCKCYIGNENVFINIIGADPNQATPFAIHIIFVHLPVWKYNIGRFQKSSSLPIFMHWPLTK